MNYVQMFFGFMPIITMFAMSCVLVLHRREIDRLKSAMMSMSMSMPLTPPTSNTIPTSSLPSDIFAGRCVDCQATVSELEPGNHMLLGKGPYRICQFCQERRR